MGMYLDLDYLAAQTPKAIKELEDLRLDKARLDWLADVKNTIGNVIFPTACVEKNFHSLRAAIDAAMLIDTPDAASGI